MADARRIAPLDGLRALAVLAVLAFHFGVGWSPGGFLGVDIFYVLSGYLITGILVRGFARDGTVKLAAFWARRARRLLPALFLVVVAVVLYIRFVALPGQYPDPRMSALSTIFYFSNWYQIGTSSNYFVATSAPSPLTHTWSLAIEEQFYLVWPLIVLAVLRLSRRPAAGPRRLLAVAVAGAVASQGLMCWGWLHGWSTTRLYFGTDTHAEGILIGSALALVMSDLSRHRRRWSPPVTAAVGALGGIVVLVVECSGSSAFLYEGGFLLVAVLTAVVVWVVVERGGSLLARSLSLRPLVYLGLISYGVYLWHYPLGVYLTPARTGMSGLSLLALRSAATLVVATASYYLVERPIMRGAFWRRLRALPVAAAATGATVLAVSAATAVTAGAAPHVQRFHLAATPGGTAEAGPPGSTAPQPGTTRPLPGKVVVLGDSTALTLSLALQATAPQGTTVIDGGHFACGLAVGSQAATSPGQTGMALGAACNDGTPTDQQWPAEDASLVSGTGPGDDVLFLAGHWETQYLEINGRWVDITQPSFRSYELAQLDRLVAIASAHGAHLDLLTMPCMDGNYTFGEPAPNSDSASRRALYDDLLYRTAARHPGQVSVIPFGQMLCPSGHFQLTVDGVQVRTPDGVHTPSYDPGDVFDGNSTEAVAKAFYNWLSPRLWPLVINPPAAPRGLVSLGASGADPSRGTRQRA